MKKLFLLAILAPLSAWGTQSAIFSGSGQYLQNSGSTVYSGDYRVELRMHDFAPTNTFGDNVIDLDWLGMYVTADPLGGISCASDRDTVTPREIGTKFGTGKSDLIIRVQRVASENRLHCEVMEVGTTAYATTSISITGSTPWANGSNNKTSIAASGGGASAYTGRIDYVRVYSSTVTLYDRFSWQDSTLGNMGSWELDGDATARLSDSSGLGKTLTATGTPTYAASKTGAPISIPRGDNSTIFALAPLKAGQTNTLGNWSYCRNNAPCASYFWTQISGPSTLRWSSRTAQTPSVSGVVATNGTDYVIRLTVTDTSGSATSTDLNLGAVAVDANDIVILTSSTTRSLLGSMIRFGSSPWVFMDQNNYQYSEVILSWIDSATQYVPYWETAQEGTVSVSTGSSVVTGNGTSFRSVFNCMGSTVNVTDVGSFISSVTWVAGDTFSDTLTEKSTVRINGTDRTVIARISSMTFTIEADLNLTSATFTARDKISFWYPHADGSMGRRDYTVTGCTSDTSLTMTEGIVRNTWDKASLVDASYSRGTQVQYGSYLDNGNNFYDNVKALWAFYYRTGLSRYRNAARTLAKRVYNTPVWDQQEWALWGELRFPRVQAHAGLWLTYHDDNSYLGTSFPTRMGYVTADQISRWGSHNYKITDTRETSYGVQSAQFIANWHPLVSSRTTAQNAVNMMVTSVYPASKGANGAYPTTGGIQTSYTFTVTNGSTTATATSAVNPYFCATRFYDTGTVSASSNVLTGNGTNWDYLMLYKQIEIFDSGLSGADRTWRSYVTQVNSSTSLTMGHIYNGSNTTGLNYALYSQTNYLMVHFGIDNDNKDTEAYTCTYSSMSPTQITLTRPYGGTTGSGRGWWSTDYTGTGYQPLTNSIALDVMETVAQYAGVSVSTTARAIQSEIMDYLQRDGDGRIASLKGYSYWSNSARCGSDVTKDLLCSGYYVSTKSANRDFAIDGTAGLSFAYLASSSTVRKSIMDDMYSGAYSMAGYPAPFAGDGTTLGVSLISGSNLLYNARNGKTYGQPYGVGNSPTWPAARLGGVAPVTTTSKPIKARLADVSGATDIVVDYLAADGTVTTSSPCTSGACTFNTDTRQNYQYRIRYRNGGGATMSTSEYVPVL